MERSLLSTYSESESKAAPDRQGHHDTRTIHCQAYLCHTRIQNSLIHMSSPLKSTIEREGSGTSAIIEYRPSAE